MAEAKKWRQGRIGCNTCQARAIPENRKRASQRPIGSDQKTIKNNATTNNSDNTTKNTTESGARTTPIKTAKNAADGQTKPIPSQHQNGGEQTTKTKQHTTKIK